MTAIIMMSRTAPATYQPTSAPADQKQETHTLVQDTHVNTAVVKLAIVDTDIMRGPVQVTS
ncbi:hypothetical protein AALO_G00272490 [Alosa alosa]|uniref:Uncharacterized protein n=1 Tax=Alosa alosa TaxID=278164 RepID=A0AAV6FUW3_9TELE|nr:hypothetical protein AALO_G00272490 [Alosa alosa]